MNWIGFLIVITVAAFLALVYAFINELLMGNRKWTEVTKYVSFRVIVTCLVIIYVVKKISL